MNPIKPVLNEQQALSPYLIVNGAAQAIDFYRRVFGATELFRLSEPGGKIGSTPASTLRPTRRSTGASGSAGCSTTRCLSYRA